MRWVTRSSGSAVSTTALVGGIKADLKLRAAEAQLHRMSDRELSDLGLCRADITFAVREAAEGVAPQFDAVAGQRVPRRTRTCAARRKPIVE